MPETLPQLIHTKSLDPSKAETWTDVTRGKFSWHTLLSSPETATSSLTMGILTCPADEGYLALHRHDQAEVYYILEGKGRMNVAENVYEVSTGDMVFVPSNAEHGIWNVASEGLGEQSEGRAKSKMKELRVLYVFAVDGFDEIKYRFS